MGNEDMESYVPQVMVKAEGFFNRPSVGDTFEGILVREVRFYKDGTEIEKPFYIFQLTKAFPKATNQPEDPHATGEWPEFTLPAGKHLGVRAWVGLMGISEKMGHKFIVTYTGDKALDGGKKQKVFSMKVSKAPVQVVAPVAPEDDEIPFDAPKGNAKGKSGKSANA